MPNEPLIKLEPGGKAPILSYNVPEPTSYSGRNFVELDFPAEYFTAKALEAPPADDEDGGSSDGGAGGGGGAGGHWPPHAVDLDAAREAVTVAVRTGLSDRRVFPNAGSIAGAIRAVGDDPRAPLVSLARPITPRLALLDPNEVATMLVAGKRPHIYKSVYGTLTCKYVSAKRELRPRLFLIETYRLSSYLGSYGAGRILKTFTLLPGEKTKISVKTFLKTEQERKQSSSILDSVTQESADDFESSLQNEQSDKKSYEETFEYHAEAEADASWGWGSAKVSGGVKGGTSSAREEFAKNVSTATQKHSAKASAKRDVQVNTSFEVKSTEQEETSIERTLENVNMSRTLNFVFRQMNQEFISILHLVDVRLGFFNGFAEAAKEVPVAQIDTLLDEYIEQSQRQSVRASVLSLVETVMDYRDQPHAFIEHVQLPNSNESFLRTRKDLVSIHQEPLTGFSVPVPGVILAVTKNVMRTEGVIVEALLGEGEALDGYARRLQELEVARRESLAAKEAAQAARESLVNQIGGSGDMGKARALARAGCKCDRPTCSCSEKDTKETAEGEDSA